MKGASRVIGIDTVPERLAFAREKSNVETIDFNEFKDVPKRIYELCPRGLDVALDCGTITFSSRLIDVLMNSGRNIPRTEDCDAQNSKDTHA